jgi:hypothetical protein
MDKENEVNIKGAAGRKGSAPPRHGHLGELKKKYNSSRVKLRSYQGEAHASPGEKF